VLSFVVVVIIVIIIIIIIIIIIVAKRLLFAHYKSMNSSMHAFDDIKTLLSK